VAENALNKAKQTAADEGLHSISYERADLNNYSWEREKFDLVLANGALHHLNQLEAVFEGIRSTLKPQGVLYACEYVGPSYQDHSPRQLQLINAAAFLVPPELRARKGLPFIVNRRLFRLLSKAYSVAARPESPEWSRRKKMVARVARTLLGRDRRESDFGIVHISPKDELLRIDPSEGVRSSEIVPLFLKYFPDAEIRPFGGGILQHALDEKFYECFDMSKPLHTRSLKMLCELERHFMDTGEIGIENAFIIARK
jgi:SAM-dependent methyltransferase